MACQFTGSPSCVCIVVAKLPCTALQYTALLRTALYYTVSLHCAGKLCTIVIQTCIQCGLMSCGFLGDQNKKNLQWGVTPEIKHCSSVKVLGFFLIILGCYLALSFFIIYINKSEYKILQLLNSTSNQFRCLMAAVPGPANCFSLLIRYIKLK